MSGREVLVSLTNILVGVRLGLKTWTLEVRYLSPQNLLNWLNV